MPKKRGRPKKKKTTTKKRKTNVKGEIKTDQILLKKRQIFIYESINNHLARNVTKEMVALDQLNNEPIVLWINSGGGNIYDGFSIIDTMKRINSQVVTIINGMAASMAGIISVCGDVRIMTENSVFMAHDGRTGIIDYFEKVFDRTKFLKKLQSKVFTVYRNRTKLSERDLSIARNGELWLMAEDCLKKGVVDKVI